MVKRPDKLEMSIRFGCGAVAGLLFACFAGMRLMVHYDMTVLLVFAGFMIVACGFAAMFFGDRFWGA